MWFYIDGENGWIPYGFAQSRPMNFKIRLPGIQFVQNSFCACFVQQRQESEQKALPSDKLEQ